MLFNSLTFLYFILAFVPMYFLMKGRERLWVSLTGSYIFYGWWDFRFLFLILALTLINYYCGIKITKERLKKDKKRFLWISIISSLSILGFFKYYNFFIDSITQVIQLLGVDQKNNALNIILPVGISFYTFQTMSYTLDVYRGKLSHENSLLRFATFVAFFPQLVAGPIVRASCFLPQLRTDRIFNKENTLAGIHQIIWGLFLKLVIADSLAIVVDQRFSFPESHNALSLLLGVVFYAFQIYGDFAGYSLIAIGIARVLGFDFPKNFDRPYFSQNFSDFWSRWHISLSSWLRDYLYIPLGGNRSGSLKMYRNLMLTMLLGGLWHGASWNFVIWGALHGFYLIIPRYLSVLAGFVGQWLPRIPLVVSQSLVPVKIFLTFMLTCIAWVFFRSTDTGDALLILEKITNLSDYDFSGVTQKFHVVKGMIIISILIVCEGISLRVSVAQVMRRYPYLVIGWSSFVMVMIFLFGTFDNNAFIYFQF